MDIPFGHLAEGQQLTGAVGVLILIVMDIPFGHSYCEANGLTLLTLES